ncbi:MAG TPA: universal stress protein [Chthonomonadaceae bacterium]|nr:universal stress protein [Chthonomonadaceae bacterium]
MDTDSERRPTPEELLARVMREEKQQKCGRLKIFLGFAAGVGKTYEMLNEARRRKQRGQDVVIGYVETHGRKGTEEQIGDLEILPRKKIAYRGATFEEMDTDAILQRRPQWVLVDELAHTNVPGSEREKRWQDVEVLLDAGINVLTTLNVQHLESLNDTIHDITGIWMRETVPDRIVREADEIVMVDITPRALIHRLERGEIYRPDKIPQALHNWFREGNLNALREIALREVAQEVDEDVEAYRRERRIQETWATHDRVMVCISPDKSSLRLIRRGWRIAQRLHAEITAVYVENAPPTEAQKEILRNDFALADRLGVPVVTLHGDVASEIVRYARENQITQIIIGHSDRTRWQEFIKGSIINRLTRDLRAIDILIVAAPVDAG